MRKKKMEFSEGIDGRVEGRIKEIAPERTKSFTIPLIISVAVMIAATVFVAVGTGLQTPGIQ